MLACLPLPTNSTTTARSPFRWELAYFMIGPEGLGLNMLRRAVSGVLLGVRA